jgi:hypothetical protein
MENLDQLSKEIIEIDYSLDRSIKEMWADFLDVMRKYNIKRGTKNKSGTGYIGDKYEWTICKTLFREQVNNALNLGFIMFNVTDEFIEPWNKENPKQQ